MKNKNLIIGGVILAGIVAFYFYNKNKNKGSVNMPSSMVDPGLRVSSSPTIVPAVETRVAIGGMKPKELTMESIAPPRPIMDRVPLAGLIPKELTMESIAPPRTIDDIFGKQTLKIGDCSKGRAC
jgi:hypothetical protein